MIDRDEKGFPLLLAGRAPGQVAAQPSDAGLMRRGARSGNTNAYASSGRFAPKPGGKVPKFKSDKIGDKMVESAKQYVAQIYQQVGGDKVTYTRSGTEITVTIWRGGAAIAAFPVPSVDSDQKTLDQFVGQAGIAGDPSNNVRTYTPQGVNPDAFARRLDMIRQAARELSEIDEAAARSFLSGKKSIDINSVDISAFTADVREHRLDDLADAIDNKLRSRGKVLGSGQDVRVQASKSWIKNTLKKLEDVERQRLIVRLQSLGWSEEQLGKAGLETKKPKGQEEEKNDSET